MREDKTYIQALMEAPSREEGDISASQAVQQCWTAEMEKLKNKWKELRLWAQENEIDLENL